jgi:hypothetical protein
VTLTVQLVLTGRDVPQLLDSEKSPLVCTRVIPAGSTGPGLVTVTGCAVLVVPTAWFPNEMLCGAIVSVTTAPCPVRPTVRGLPAELSVIVKIPVRVPVAVGVKVT